MELSLQKWQPPALFLTTTRASGNSVDLKWTKFAREIQAFLENIAAGLPIKYACADSGLVYSTVCQWLNPRQPIHDPKFEALFDHAHAQAVKTRIKAINKSRDWKAAAFWLERNTPEFRPKSMVAHAHSEVNAADSEASGKRGASLSLSASELTKLSASHSRLIAKLGNQPKPNVKTNPKRHDQP